MASPQGIRVRHSRECGRQENGSRCLGKPRCHPTYEAWVYAKRENKKIRRSFPTLAAARSWRTDALKLVKDKKLRAPSSRTLHQEVDEWFAGARDGRILNRQKQRYKPAVLRIYWTSLDKRVLPELGDRRLADIDHADLLELKEQLLGAGCSASTIRNTFTPLQAVYRRACRERHRAYESGARPGAADSRQPRSSGDPQASGGVAEGAWRPGASLGDGILRRLAPRRTPGASGSECGPRGWND